MDDLHLWPLIEARAEASPDALFAVDELDRKLTFAGYRDGCLRCAAGLHEMGIGPGTVVSWQLPTWLEAMLLVGGLARVGAVQNPLLPFLREQEVGFITRQTGARFLFVPRMFRGFDHEAMARSIAKSGDAMEVVVIDRSLPEGAPSTLTPFPEAPGAADPIRWIFYSSGTTAEPKGVKHTDLSVGTPGKAMAEVLELEADDRSALVFPFTHVGGINWLFAGLISGCSHILVEAFDPTTTIDVLRKHRVTVAGAGTIFHQGYLAAQRANPEGPIFPDLRVCPGGGAPKPPGLHVDVKAQLGGIGIASGYGLTEHPIATMCRIGDPDPKLADTEGRPTRGTEVRIVGPDEIPLAVGEDGEIRLRGPHLFRGYVDESLHAAAFDVAGFLRTGDLGHVDEAGFLTITGRLKDVIIRKGENISAKEVEDHLFEHPEIADVAVVGLPDPASGERACAVVVPANPAVGFSFETMASFLAERGLARQKFPEQLELVDALPRNASGKILKNELRKRFTTQDD
ncbi:MAG: AMP-binding protein [Deltaproteobacteria bacterium]|nr:AMP-binding protein [Deltaproteobacteria bacterium]MBW2395244.1 AMP-binding protein [Deltaproteobacteria bacterium]